MSPQEVEQEYELVRKAQRNLDNFQPLYDRYFERIFQFIYRRTDHEELTADLTSQTFLRAMQHLKKFRPQGVPFSAWLYRIASNEVNYYYRKSKRRQVFSLETERVNRMVQPAEDSEASSGWMERLQDLLQELSTDELLILELKVYELRTFKEIAFIQKISESAAKMRFYRIIEKLKKLGAVNWSEDDEA